MLSLHQPSPALFDGLDQAILMADGLVVYSGPPAEAAAGMAALGLPAPKGVSVAEHMLHAVSDPESHAAVVARVRARAAGGNGGNGASGFAALGAVKEEAGGAAAGAGGLPLARAASRQRSLTFAEAATVLGPDAGADAAPDAAPSPPPPPALARFRRRLSGAGAGAAHSTDGGASVAPSLRFSTAGGAAPGAAPHKTLAARRRRAARQLGVLFWRGLADMLRNPMLTAFHALGGLALGLLVGVIFYQVRAVLCVCCDLFGVICFMGVICVGRRRRRRGGCFCVRPGTGERRLRHPAPQTTSQNMKPPNKTYINAATTTRNNNNKQPPNDAKTQVSLDTTGAQNRLGAIFFGLALMAFTSVTSVDLVQAERHAA